MKRKAYSEEETKGERGRTKIVLACWLAQVRIKDRANEKANRSENIEKDERSKEPMKQISVSRKSTVEENEVRRRKEKNCLSNALHGIMRDIAFSLYKIETVRWIFFILYNLYHSVSIVRYKCRML